MKILERDDMKKDKITSLELLKQINYVSEAGSNYSSPRP